jgi:putative hydrolase of the HAD superfamily
MSFEAVVLDVGGVLLLPDPEAIGAALTAAGIEHRPGALPWAHYGGVAALDAHLEQWPAGGAPGHYLSGFAAAAGVSGSRAGEAAEVLRDVFAQPSIEVWCHLTPWARPDLRALAERGLPTAVVSNSDGTVAQSLQLNGLAQVGAGPGLEVAAIVDSAVVGVAKPDPRVFEPALDALQLAPQRCLYVGDTVAFDVVGARAAGLACVHLDPFGTCTADDHPHALTLADAW